MGHDERMAVKIPTPDEIRKMLAEKRRNADAVASKLDEAANQAAQLDEQVRTRDNKIRDQAAEIESLQVAVAKLRDTGRNTISEARGRLDELCRKHATEPADELLRMVNERVPVLGQDGAPQMGDDGRPLMRFALPPDMRANILLKMMEFRMPKLRAAETQGGAAAGGARIVIVKFGDHTNPEKLANARVVDV